MEINDCNIFMPSIVSPWTKLRDYLATAIVVGGVGYAVYQLYKVRLTSQHFILCKAFLNWLLCTKQNAPVIPVQTKLKSASLCPQKYIAPIWFGPTKEQQQLADIQASVKELEGNIAETLRAIQEMQSTLKRQQDSLDTVVTTDMASRVTLPHTLSQAMCTF